MNMDNDSYAQIIDSLHDGLYCVDNNNIITYWNKAAERISGFTASEVLGKSRSDTMLIHVDIAGRSRSQDTCPLAATLIDGINRELEIYIQHKDGHRLPVLVRVSTIKDSRGTIIGGVELFTDISNLQDNHLRILELEKLALLDNLTQLANRNYLERELQARFEEFKRHKVPFGVLFIDIDHFKKVNDTYGHDVGDEVLRHVARTFATNSRPFDLYGRWGGEEFLGIIRNVTADHLIHLGNRLRYLIEDSDICHQKHTINITVSMGATQVGEHDTIETLIKRADTLLYASKQNGRNRLTMG